MPITSSRPKWSYQTKNPKRTKKKKKKVYDDSEFTIKIGDDKITDIIDQRIVSITPFVFWFYGLCISIGWRYAREK